MAAAIRPEQDAYGRLLLAQLEEGEASEIMEREDGFIYCGDPSDYFSPFRRWPAAERRAMRFVRGRVLDVGCGAGRVSLHLQERGHDVVAIDESPLAVEVARRRGVRDTRTLGLASADERLGRFDTVLVLRNNFGLSGPAGRAGGLLRRLERMTSDRGRVVTDSVDPGRIPAEMRTTLRFRVRFRRYASPWFRYLMLTPEELGALVDGSGWTVARCLRDETPRYVVVLEKGG